MFKNPIFWVFLLIITWLCMKNKIFKNGQNLQITENFNLSELHSKDGSDMPAEVFENLVKLINKVQKLRTESGLPFKVNSAYRSEAHNKKVGGAKNSLHTKGMAIDISAPIGTELRQFLLAKRENWKGGFGLYSWGVHLDIGPERNWNA
jgi:uncharacterized protein YcbK (DUF882 family)